MPEAIIQPQGFARLNPASRIATALRTVVIGGMDRDIVTGKRLSGPYDFADGSQFYVKRNPVGLATSFNKVAWRAALPTPVGTQSYVEFWYGYPTADNGNKGSGTNDPTFATGSTNNAAAIVTRLGNNHSDVSAEHWGTLYRWSDVFYGAGEALTPGVLTLLIVVRRQDRMELWRDGILKRTVMVAPQDLGSCGFVVGAFLENDYWTSSSDMLLSGRAVIDASADEIRAFSGNPWSLFDTHDVQDEIAEVADTTLAGVAFNQASGAGALATSIRFTAGAAAAASVTGSLSTAVRMSGAATAAASASAGLATSVTFSGAAVASASASGSLAGGAASLSGVVTASAAVSGVLSTSIRPAGTASAQAGASASLTTAVRLASAGVASATAVGSLSTGIALSGAAQATAAASGTLAGGAAQLSGAAVASASAAGTLATNVTLTGSATAQATATGSTSAVGAVLSGAAVASAGASGALLTTIRMTGLTAASASASGSLAGSGIQLSGSASASALTSASLATSIALGGAAKAVATGSAGLMTYIRLTGSATAAWSASGALSFGERIDYARAPDGAGYAPYAAEPTTRPTSMATARPANTQRNYR